MDNAVTDAQLIARLSADIDMWHEIEPEDRGNILDVARAIEAQARAQALEQAAQVCEENGAKPYGRQCSMCAADIRALITAPEGKPCPKCGVLDAICKTPDCAMLRPAASAGNQDALDAARLDLTGLPLLPQPAWTYIDVARECLEVPCYNAKQMQEYALAAMVQKGSDQ